RHRPLQRPAPVRAGEGPGRRGPAVRRGLASGGPDRRPPAHRGAACDGPRSRPSRRLVPARHAGAAGPRGAVGGPDGGLCRGRGREATMTHEERRDPIEARVLEHLGRLRLTATREALPALLMEAARKKWTYLDFIDQLTRREVESRQDKRVRMGMTIAHFPTVRTLEGFDFAAQPSVDERLVRELATGSFVAHGTNVLLFGAPRLGKTHP